MLRWLVLLVVLGASPLCAATLTVTNLNDTGAGSLRATVAAAAANDEIVFDATLAGGTINIASVISPAVALTITGPVDANGKPNLTLDGGDTVGFFAPSEDFTLSNLRLFGGRVGINSGVVSTADHLVIDNCVFESNEAGNGGGAVYANGAYVLLLDCTFVDNVGGSTGAGALVVRNSSATIRRCTFASNSSGSAGAVMFLASAAGSVLTIVVEDSTFSGNTSSGASYPAGAIAVISTSNNPNSQSVSATRCTFSNNQGGSGDCIAMLSQTVDNAAHFTARDSIFTDSSAGTMFYVQLNGAAGGFSSLGHNICSDAPAWMTAPGDQVNTNPLLAALADNGGLTQTHAIDTTSPAHNAGDANAVLSNDQRSRPRNATPDIGAFELQGADISVAESAAAIASGATVLGLTVATPGSAQSRTFTITNAASAEQDLTVTLPVSISGLVNCTAVATTQPGANLTPGSSSDLIVEATPTVGGFFTYTVTIISNDPNAPAFSFTVAGYAQVPASSSGSGGDDGNDDGCSTGTSWGVPVMFALALLLFVCARRRHDARA